MARADITHIRDVPSPVASRLGMTDKEIGYRIDNMGPFLLYIPIEDYTPQEALKRIQVKLKEWAEVVGKTLEQK